MTVRDDICRALHDAIEWRVGLADAQPPGSPEQRRSLDLAKRYRKILRRRYGSDKTAFDQRFEGAQLVSVYDASPEQRKKWNKL